VLISIVDAVYIVNLGGGAVWPGALYVCFGGWGGLASVIRASPAIGQSDSCVFTRYVAFCGLTSDVTSDWGSLAICLRSCKIQPRWPLWLTAFVFLSSCLSAPPPSQLVCSASHQENAVMLSSACFSHAPLTWLHCLPWVAMDKHQPHFR
jgi:hypothetical protein